MTPAVAHRQYDYKAGNPGRFQADEDGGYFKPEGYKINEHSAKKGRKNSG